MVERLDDLILHQSIQRTDVGYHASDRIDLSMNGDVAIPLTALMIVLYSREGITARHGGGI